VELPDLADYTAGLTEMFEKHGTDGTWYAHASVGCLHVRPVLNLKQDKDVKKLRAIAEEAFDLVRKLQGLAFRRTWRRLVRSEFHEKMFGARMMDSFEEVKDRFDPAACSTPARSSMPRRWTTARCSASSRTTRCRVRRPRFDWSAGPVLPAVSRVPSRCATTMAPAAS
jgi:hypothetical protein